MAKNKKAPIGKAELEALNLIIRECTETESMCADCDRCGIDVSPEREKNARQLEDAKNLKRTFFPTAR